jgi:signal transduction histidine kinase
LIDTDLGLVSCKSIIEKHGGTIFVKMQVRKDFYHENTKKLQIQTDSMMLE